ncbi:MAG: OsmC family protein [Sphingobacterium sp.]
MAEEVQVSIGKEKYTTTISYGELEILADEPEELGGQNKGLAPSQLLLSSIGACKAITMKMYADKKEWPLENIHIQLHSEVQRSDRQQTTYIRCNIVIEGALDSEQKKRIHTIGEKCPVQKILENPVVIESNLIDTD